MSWATGGNTLQEVQDNFDKTYPEANSDVRAQFEATLHSAEALLEQVAIDGDSAMASVNKYNGETRISVSGHVYLNTTGEEGGNTMSETPQEANPGTEEGTTSAPEEAQPTTPASEPATPTAPAEGDEAATPQTDESTDQ